MNKIITQDVQNDNQISKSINRFFKRFRIAALLKSANASKAKGVSPVDIFQYLFLLVFSNRSMYMNLLMGKNLPPFAQDTAYRFMKMSHINWIRFTTMLASVIIKDAIEPLTSETRKNVLIIDDSLFERNRSKKVELLTKIFDHAKKSYHLGFRMLTLGWSDGNTFLPVNSILLSSENEKSRINEAADMDKRTLGYKRRELSKTKGTVAMLELLRAAKAAKIPAKHVLFDSWFTSPNSILAIKKIGYDIIGMVKKTPKMHFIYNGNQMSLPEIYKQSKKRRGRSRHLLSVDIEVMKDGESIPAKVVYVRNKNKRKDYLCLISSDMTLNEDEIIRLYTRRWEIEVFFKVCKSYLKLGKECNSLSFDAMTAHTSIIFSRYMMLSVENRESKDPRSLGEIFLLFSDELTEVTWIQAFQLLLQLFKEQLTTDICLPESKVLEVMNAFMDMIPSFIKERLQTA